MAIELVTGSIAGVFQTSREKMAWSFDPVMTSGKSLGLSNAMASSPMGVFGKLIFEVNADKLVPFDQLQRQFNTVWAEHATVGAQWPKNEFQGTGQLTTTMDITFAASYGVQPRAMISLLESLAREGRVETLVIGGAMYGYQPWFIESISENWQRFMRNGKLLRATCSVTFKQYF